MKRRTRTTHRRFIVDPATGRTLDTWTGELLPGPGRLRRTYETGCDIVFGSGGRDRQSAPRIPFVGRALAWLMVAVASSLIYLALSIGGCLQ